MKDIPATRLAALVLTALVMLPITGHAKEDPALDEYCGEMNPHMDYHGLYYGPFDYTNPEDRAKHLVVVENHHFTAKVQTLEGGSTANDVGGDLAYTLRAFPNHHQALETLIRLWVKQKQDPPRGMEYSVNCWFDRAIRWRPEDAVVRVLYGNYLLRSDKVDKAIDEYKVAEKMGFLNANLFYSMGLALVEKKDYPGALEYAHKAYEAGYPLPGLRDKLIRLGVWQNAKAVTKKKAQ